MIEEKANVFVSIFLGLTLQPTEGLNSNHTFKTIVVCDWKTSEKKCNALKYYFYV